MRNLYSRTALIVALSYALLIAGIFIYGWRASDNEGRVWLFLFFGLPWSFVMLAVPSANEIVIGFLCFLALGLDVVTVYIFALSLVKIFSSHSD